MKTISCSAEYGHGGLGRHLEELVEAARATGGLAHYYTSRPVPNDAAGIAVRESVASILGRWTPVRFSQSWRGFLGEELFDRRLARRINPGRTHVGFSFQSAHTFRSARNRGSDRLELVSPTCHVDAVKRRYEAARRAHPIERSWLGEAQRRKALREYEAADAIVCASEYVRESFLEAGFQSEKLTLFPLSAPPRYRNLLTPASSPRSTFRIVYVGALSVAKGTPVLLDAFARLKVPNAELMLVGGWGTRGMRRYLAVRCRQDRRIHVVPSDPLPYFQSADLYVHPSYQDGWSYAVAEAIACEVPAVVTEDTGAKELVQHGVNGFIVPTGSVSALAGAIETSYEQIVSTAGPRDRPLAI